MSANIYSKRGHEKAFHVRLRQVRERVLIAAAPLFLCLIPADAIWALVERRNGDYEADAMILARDCSSVMEF